MKKVGIVSCYFKNNYGSALQAYATQKVLDDNGIENETIEIEHNVDFKKGKRAYYISQITNFHFIKEKLGMVKLKFDKMVNKQLGENIAIRNKKYKEFQQEFRLSKPMGSYKELTSYAKENYNHVIVGSDQLWLPVNVVADYYTLTWVPDAINKISLATSFGIHNIDTKYKTKYQNFLSRINYLSTREQSGVALIKKMTGKDAKLACDPTLLLSKEEWEELISEKPMIQTPYIFCYFLGKNIEHRKFAERLKAKTGCKIVSINHADEYVAYSDVFADIIPYDVGPKEWINLIKYAEYVCTDSFHGTVFSLIFNKIFFDFRRYASNSKMSTNSRLDSLLEVMSVPKNRILSGKEDVEQVLTNTIDYDKVNKRLQVVREDTKRWLFFALGKDRNNET